MVFTVSEVSPGADLGFREGGVGVEIGERAKRARENFDYLIIHKVKFGLSGNNTLHTAYSKFDLGSVPVTNQ